MKTNHYIPPIHTLWQSSVIAWIILAGEGIALILALSAYGQQPGLGVRFGLISLVVQWISLTTLLELYLFRHWLSRLSLQPMMYLSLLLLMLSTWLVFSLSWWLLSDLWPLLHGKRGTVFLQFTGIALTVGLLAMSVFHNRWRATQLAIDARQARLAALQARIRPHFLFNTLNTAAALVHLEADKAETLLLDLADLFRAALNNAKEIPLQEEFNLTQRYLEIELLRLGKRLTLVWEVATIPPNIHVPPLTIQPLVENAIYHGVEPSITGGDIYIGLRIVQKTLLITINNSLSPSATARTGGHQIGLKAVQARLQAQSDGQAQLIATEENNRYEVLIKIPIK